jgi:gluconate 2-dehydrogenase subunit 3-like protein
MTSQTRRNWIVSIGQTAIGTGLAGKLFAEESRAETLPPGLYGPSSDHLSHALTSADSFHPIPADCPTDYLRPPNGDFQPRFFSASEFSVVRRLTELLVGEVTPGLHQEIAEWIDLQVASSEGIRRAEHGLQTLHGSLAIAYYGSSRRLDANPKDLARVCRTGLGWLPADFLSLEAARQLSLVESISDELRDPQSENPGTQLFDYLKAETIRGLYTSKAGLKELDYQGNAFYARSPGCGAKS